MYEYIQISKINDFIFCPYSVYLHGIYENFDAGVCHESPQTKGKIKHQCIDKGTYSTSAHIFQGISVFSEKFGIIGKIDIYDSLKKNLVERKNKIKQIYDGQKYQLYAQKICLEEMGFQVEKMIIHSLEDNKNYPIEFGRLEINNFLEILKEMRNFDLRDWDMKSISKNKCEKCIYKVLCDFKC